MPAPTNTPNTSAKAGGTGIRKIATRFNVGTGTVQRIKGEMAA